MEQTNYSQAYNALSHVALFLKERKEKEDILSQYYEAKNALDSTEKYYIKELNKLQQTIKDKEDMQCDYEKRITNLKKKSHDMYTDMKYYKEELMKSREKHRESERSLEKTIEDLKYDIRSLKKKLRKIEDIERSEMSCQTDIDITKRMSLNIPDYNVIINSMTSVSGIPIIEAPVQDPVEVPVIQLPAIEVSAVELPVQDPVIQLPIVEVPAIELPEVESINAINSLILLLNKNAISDLDIKKDIYDIIEENFGTEENPLWFYTVEISGAKLLVLNETFRWLIESKKTSLGSYTKQLTDSSIIKLSTILNGRKCDRLCISGKALLDICSKLMIKYSDCTDQFDIVLKALDKICWEFKVVKQ